MNFAGFSEFDVVDTNHIHGIGIGRYIQGDGVGDPMILLNGDEAPLCVDPILWRTAYAAAGGQNALFVSGYRVEVDLSSGYSGRQWHPTLGCIIRKDDGAYLCLPNPEQFGGEISLVCVATDLPKAGAVVVFNRWQLVRGDGDKADIAGPFVAKARGA